MTPRFAPVLERPKDFSHCTLEDLIDELAKACVAHKRSDDAQHFHNVEILKDAVSARLSGTTNIVAAFTTFCYDFAHNERSQAKPTDVVHNNTYKSFRQVLLDLPCKP